MVEIRSEGGRGIFVCRDILDRGAEMLYNTSSGEFFDIFFDVVSIAFSVVDVITNPTDPLAWAGLAGDVIDLVPFVTGVGETVKIVGGALEVAETIDNAYDAASTLDKGSD